jgi:hypothetical protein
MSRVIAAPASDRGSDAGVQTFLLGQNAAGQWIIRDTAGLNAGLFRSREAAIRYVRYECADRNVDIALMPDGTPLEFLPGHLDRAA